MIESFAEQTDVNGTPRLHPAVRRRILTASPNPAMQMHDSGFASKTVLRLLSNISILLTALSKCCAAREQ